MIKIKTSPSSYFFSDNIKINPGKETQVDIKKLTTTQLIDIIEGYSIKTIITDDIELFKKELSSRNNANISEEENFLGLESKVNTLQTAFNNLVVGEVESLVYWSSTDW